MGASQFLQEGNRQFSSTRLAFMLWVVGVLVMWLVASWRATALVPIDGTVLTMLGILMSGKVVQKFGEKGSGTAEGGS